jgi:hypothetical protein
MYDHISKITRAKKAGGRAPAKQARNPNSCSKTSSMWVAHVCGPSLLRRQKITVGLSKNMRPSLRNKRKQKRTQNLAQVVEI